MGHSLQRGYTLPSGLHFPCTLVMSFLNVLIKSVLHIRVIRSVSDNLQFVTLAKFTAAFSCSKTAFLKDDLLCHSMVFKIPFIDVLNDVILIDRFVLGKDLRKLSY